ncbi:hypothetical protein COX05_01560 [candidate division WWE3 bacterium CG22_combo_CG10-13_8_21_14_all_39_12]|uniref:DUF5659 domain-containing protein n=2 Tax=Katanobacteria TaxID=422282 RepID=A0A2M7X1L7_UNCKA|nr:MAG: hypothetical protein COX05_01560 [candidate division WWE3 bacterium CG22_combo_CG10-13_8_21_14_all_39_12]PJA40047.1 MAG: hypothetical protein CO179_03570 [candidate division WWE3 bacterium CG_4_9_14_3_um_filter_39_7]
MRDTNKKYETQNLNLAGALHTKGCTLIDFTKNPDSKITFIFDHYVDCKEYEKQWLLNTLEVKAFEYSQSLKLMKGVLYGDR